MSSRWPQGQQNQRSPYAAYDEALPEGNGADQPSEGGGWQASGQSGYGDQWAHGSARHAGPAVAQAVAEPWAPPRQDFDGDPRRPSGPAPSGGGAGQYQREWDESGGGFGDDADYAWFDYLSGGRSSEPRPEEPSRREGRDPARRGPTRTERLRSRRAKAAETGQAGPSATDPGYRPSASPGQDAPAATDPGRGRRSSRPSQNEQAGPDVGGAAGPAAAADAAYGRAGTRSRHGRREAPAEPEYGQAPGDGWQAPTDPGYGRQAPARQQDHGRGRPAADSGYGRDDAAGWQAGGQAADHTQAAGWPAAGDRAPDQAHLRGWPAAGDQRDDQAPVGGWTGAAEPQYGPVQVNDWSAVMPRHDWGPAADWQAPGNRRGDQAPAADWQAAGERRGDQAPAEADWRAADAARGQAPGWAADPGYDQRTRRGRPGSRDPRQDQNHVPGWPAAADYAPDEPRTDWPAAGDPRAERPPAAGWPAAGDPRADQAWPAAGDRGRGQAGVVRGPAGPGTGHSPGRGWQATDGGYQQHPEDGWRGNAEAGYAWPATADPRQDQAPAQGWPETGEDYGWQAPDDSGYSQAVGPGWAADAAALADTGPQARGHGGTGPGRQRRGADRGERAGGPGGARDGAAAAKTLERQRGGAAPRRDDGRPDGAEASAVRAPDRQGPAPRSARRPEAQTATKKKKQPSAKAKGNAAAQRAPRLLRPQAPGEQATPQWARPKGAKKARRKLTTRVLAVAGASAVVAGAAVVVLTRSGGGVDHVVTAPENLGAYAKKPQLAQQMDAAALREQILKQSAGEVHDVVYGVYEDAAGAHGASAPQIMLFMGGNLSGTSPGSFISAFTGKLENAETAEAGPLGGEAACVPSVNGRGAECVWADNDTFGVVASQTLSPSSLANEMRHMRPMVEHRASTGQ
jgi:hypothetical protein